VGAGIAGSQLLGGVAESSQEFGIIECAASLFAEGVEAGRCLEQVPQ
jgi:hypothetical protein